jgi:proline dehydrogenase
MSDNISYNLADHEDTIMLPNTYHLRKGCYALLNTSCEENTSVAGQTSRELTLIKAERERRE